jgi:hypothetical protein
MSADNRNLSRRNFLQAGAALGATLGGAGAAGAQSGLVVPRPAGAQSVVGLRFEPYRTVRIGLIGAGGRGMGLLRDLLAIEHVEVRAACDIVPEKAQRAAAAIQRAGQAAPALYTAGERDFENLCRRDDLDLLYIATPWNWHVPMAVEGMLQGKHVAVEVPAAVTMEECWQLVDTSERTRRHCVMLENCCYGETELLALNMIRAGLFGEILHAEAAYNHDLRGLLFANESEGLWRRFEHLDRDGNLYPTHGLGPVANYMDINRGDRFSYLVSMSSPSVGLYEYREKHLPRDDPRWSEEYACGDVNTSLIKTAKGRTIMLQHTVSTPHPYDRINLVSGTKAIFRDYPPRLYVDGQEGGEQWISPEGHKEQYGHSLWKRVGELARRLGGHGGMDFIMSYRLIECMREGLEPDMDVYDAAAWSAPGPLSEDSVRSGSAPAAFPDFTRGGWELPRTQIIPS